MELISAAQRRRSERRNALTVVATFIVAGLGWVFVTDVLLYALTRDRVLVARVETAKGLVFVLLAAMLLYGVARRSASRLTHVEATLAAVIDSIADGVLLLGPDRTIAHANPAALRILGCDRMEELLGMGAEAFSRRFRVSYTNRALVPPNRFASQRVFDEGGPLRYKAILYRGEDAVTFIATAAAVRCHAEERPKLVVSVMHDITELEQMDRARDDLFAASAHSLKTPIAIIKANAQLLSQHRSLSSADRVVSAIDRQCNRIDRFVQNLLVFSRIRSRTLQLHPRKLPLDILVADIVEDARRSTSIHLEIAVSPRVHADRERLSLALQNVLEEAVCHAIRGSVILIELACHGCDAELRLRYRAPPADDNIPDTLKAFDESGIALVVTTSIIEAHAGALSRDTSGDETTIRVRLPLAEKPDERVEAA